MSKAKKANKGLPPLEPRLAKILGKSEKITFYRSTYRDFRTGKSAGAKGEAKDLLRKLGVQPQDDSAFYEHQEASVDEKVGETFFEFEGDVAQDVYRSITAFRLGYALFRQGNSHGAKGEVTAVTALMDKEHANFLPIGQRVQALRMANLAPGPPRPITKLHVHFGAGKLGMGLLLPALHASGLPFCLVDGPFGDYGCLAKADGEEWTFTVNGEDIQTVKLVTKLSHLPEDLHHESTRLFVCSTDTELVGKVMDMASTVSTALGPVLHKVIPPYFKEPRDKTIYCCENDHGSVDELRKTLEGKCNVVTCMVDRICAGRDVDEKERKIHITTEPYKGEVVVMNPPLGVPLPAFSGKNIKKPGSAAEANYFTSKKITFVNGLHTTLAFMTLCKTDDGDVAGDHDLLKPKDVSAAEQKMLWHWAVARALLVLYEHDISTIKGAHGVKTDDEVCQVLIDYARTTLERFGTIDDKTSRVLGGGVSNRWNGRLKNTQEFLDSQPKLDELQKRLMKLADVKEKELRKDIAKLVADSKRFVGKAPAWSSA